MEYPIRGAAATCRTFAPLRSYVLAVVVGALIAAAVPAAAQSNFVADLDRLVSRAMAAWHVPGLAVAVVEGERIVAMRTYGVRDGARRLPVTPRTLFAIGSVTKSFTVAGLALLAADGRIVWDRPVVTYLPNFGLHDKRQSAAITVRDLVTHRAGLPRHDALWYFNVYSRAELVRRMRHLVPVAGIGEAFQYHNMMVMVAGYLAERVARKPWEAFTRERILKPLGMVDTRLSLAGFLEAGDRAEPYFPAQGGVVPVPLRDTDVMGPAASVYSNLRDMTVWLRFQLGLGAVDGRRVLSQKAMADIRIPRIRIPGPAGDPALGPESYAMGLYVVAYRGNMVLRHPGVIDGYSALLSFMPGRGAGLVVLTNMSGRNPVPTIVERYIYDRALARPPLPWLERHIEAEEKAAKIAVEKAPAEPPASGAPGHDLRVFAGAYEHPAYGTMHISLAPDGAGLVGLLNNVRFTLRHLRGETWTVAETAWPLRQGLRIAFSMNSAGVFDRLSTPLADSPNYRLKAGDLVFDRPGSGRPDAGHGHRH